MNKIDGKKLADQIKISLRNKVKRLERANIRPKLVIIQIGNDQQSTIYVRQKISAAQSIGIETQLIKLPTRLKTPRIYETMEQLNNDKLTHGIIIQLPLPKRFDTDTDNIINLIDPAKDVDGLTSFNQRRLARREAIIPATPLGILKLLEYYRVPIKNSRMAVIGRSRLVGAPLKILLKSRGAKVVVGHSRTQDLSRLTRNADIIISAAGVPGLVTADMIKSESVLIDVGVSTVAGRLIGDITPEAKDKARLATPTIGGVGPMTVISLLSNVIDATQYQLRKLKANEAKKLTKLIH